MILAAVYAGFPVALNGISAAREVLQQRGGGPEGAAVAQESAAAGEDRYECGLRVLERFSGGAGAAVLERLKDLAPDLARFMVEFSLNVGSSRGDVVEVIQQMAVYAGFPAALNGLAAAREVFEQRG
jgi:4-carboxymuconolactone decarboxylase